MQSALQIHCILYDKPGKVLQDVFCAVLHCAGAVL